MLFRKRKRRPSSVVGTGAGSARSPWAASDEYLIEHGMMLKGAELTRRGRRIRQYAVMVGGMMHLVTSGDTVDRAIYEALLSAEAIRPPDAPLSREDEGEEL